MQEGWYYFSPYSFSPISLWKDLLIAFYHSCDLWNICIHSSPALFTLAVNISKYNYMNGAVESAAQRAVVWKSCEKEMNLHCILGDLSLECSSPHDRVTFYISMLMWWASAPPGSLISWMSLYAHSLSHKLDHSVFPLPFLFRTCSPGRHDSRLQSFGLSSMPQWDAGTAKTARRISVKQDPVLYVFVCVFNMIVESNLWLWCCKHHAPPVRGMNVFHQ